MNKSLIESLFISIFMGVVLLNAKIGFCANSQLNPQIEILKQPQPNWSSDFPFDSDTLWGKIKAIITTPKEELTRERIESVLHMKFPNAPHSYSQDGWLSVAKEEIDWYFFIEFIAASKFKYFEFGFPRKENDLGVYKSQFCMSADSFALYLNTVGWPQTVARPGHLEPMLGEFSFYNQEGTLRIFFDEESRCIQGLTMSLDFRSH